MKDDIDITNNRKISRKDFLKLLGALGLSFGIGGNLLDAYKKIYATPISSFDEPDAYFEDNDPFYCIPEDTDWTQEECDAINKRNFETLPEDTDIPEEPFDWDPPRDKVDELDETSPGFSWENNDRSIGDRSRGSGGSRDNSLVKDPEDTLLKVVTWNAHGFDNCQLSDEKLCEKQPQAYEYTIDRVANYIRKETPDIIFFQELSNKRRKVTNEDTLTYIKHFLHRAGYTTYTFVPAKDPRWDPRWDGNPKWGEAGHGILSKYPLRNAKTHPVKLELKTNPITFPPSSILEVEVYNLPQSKSIGPIRLLSSHFTHAYTGRPWTNKEDRLNCSNVVVKVLQNVTDPVIFGGDLNAHPWTIEMKPLFSILDDSYLKSSSKPVTCGENPDNKRIDYVFYRGNKYRNFRVLSWSGPCRTDGLSDHAIITVMMQQEINVNRKDR